jgi:hypothetical protein
MFRLRKASDAQGVRKEFYGGVNVQVTQPIWASSSPAMVLLMLFMFVCFKLILEQS